MKTILCFDKSDPVLHQFVVQTELVIYVELEPIHAGGDFYCLLSVQETFSDPYLLITHTRGPVVEISNLPKKRVSVLFPGDNDLVDYDLFIACHY